jgi:Bax protein
MFALAKLKKRYEKYDRKILVISTLSFIFAVFFVVATFYYFFLKKKNSFSPITYTHIKEIIVIYKKINSVKDIVPINCQSVTPIVYTKVISLDNLPVPEKKKKFIDIVLPSILIAEFKIAQERKLIENIRNKIANGEKLTADEEKFLSKTLEKYKAQDIAELLEKINIHPVSIVLAQAAIESGWGSSRFFVKGNNIFGAWTWDKKAKKIPASKNKKVFLRKFNNILESVEDYYYSLNVSWAYKKFRLVRLKTSDPLLLSKHLDKYSILRKRYVEKIKTVIKENNLQQYDNCKINPDYIIN